ncbi:LOW QUALITY PROTEIN: NADPH oxidase 1 [Thomomys bottae]
MGNWIVHHWFFLFLVVWLGLNVYLFVSAFLYFEKNEKYYYTRQILGTALAVARASARCLNFNTMLILVPVCRNLLSFLRGTCSFCNRTLRKPLDNNLKFHKLVAYMICIFTAIHIIAHLFNFERYSGSHQGQNGPLAFVLSNLYHSEKQGNSWLNPFQSPEWQLGTTILLHMALCIASWKWIIAPFFLYVLERFLRFCRSRQKVVITKVVMHPSKVLELQMLKRGFSMEVGQYIFVNCPSISFLEWHPFTLTSAPEEDFFSIHIRAAGDWTENLIRAFEQQHSPMPRIEVDGPFGTVSEDVFQYEVSVLIGAGIGVTPFASILKSIWYKFQRDDHNLKTQKIYFYWICRETGAFAWFKDLLTSLEQEMEGLGKMDFLNYRLFLTGWDNNIAGHAALNFDQATDILTGLRQKTFFGRPMWDNEFSTIATAHPKSAVGVFLCGPRTLAKTLRKCCHQFSSLDPRKVQFYFNKENF